MAKQKVEVPFTVLKNLVDEYQLTLGQMAENLKLSPSMIRQVLVGKSKITPHLALRLAKYFGQTAEYWLNLQNQYDLAELKKDAKFSTSLQNVPKAKKPARGSKKKEDPKAEKAKAEKPVKAKKEASPKAEKSVKASKPPKAAKEEKPVKAASKLPKAVKEPTPKAPAKSPRGSKKAKPDKEQGLVDTLIKKKSKPHTILIKKDEPVPVPDNEPEVFPENEPGFSSESIEPSSPRKPTPSPEESPPEEDQNENSPPINGSFDF
jgi:addiction module HigA family antidote